MKIKKSTTKKLFYEILLFTLLAACILACKKAESPGPTEVFMQAKNFNPKQITVSVGTTVTWTNKESTLHTVTSNATLFNSGKMDNGNSFKYQFNAKGVFDYRCNFHTPTMVGTVIVQ
jgi:plastocyanin